MQKGRLKNANIIWVLSLYGTSVGAGTLFLPIEIGTRGPIIFCAMLLLALPIALLPHRLLCRVCMAETSSPAAERLSGQLFNQNGTSWLTLLYFLAFYPVVLVYGISLVNAIDNYLTVHMHLPVVNRLMLSFVCMAVLFVILSKGRDKVVRTMSVLALPFAAAMMAIAIVLIPYWSIDHLTQQVQQIGNKSVVMSLKELWLALPLVTFSFACAPIILPLASYYREKEANGEQQALRVINIAYAAIFISIIFFVFSCVASLPRAVFEQAKTDNLSVLSVMNTGGGFGLIYLLAPFIAMIGMTKSFLGVSLSVMETFAQCALVLLPEKKPRAVQVTRKISTLVLFLFTWIVVYFNPGVITIIETLCGPLIAIMIYLVPAYAVYKFEIFRPLRGKKTVFIALSGLATLSALLYTII